MRTVLKVSLVVLGALLLAACRGGGGKSASAPTPAGRTALATVTRAVAPSPTPGTAETPLVATSTRVPPAAPTDTPVPPPPPSSENTSVPPPAPTDTPTPRPSGPVALTVVAKDIAFHPTALTARAGLIIGIVFDNQDAGTQHNIHFFRGDSPAAPTLGSTAVSTGPAQAGLALGSLSPGVYFYHCDVHPDQMKGTLTIS